MQFARALACQNLVESEKSAENIKQKLENRNLIKTGDGADTKEILGACGKLRATHRSSPTKCVHILAASTVRKSTFSLLLSFFASEKRK